ncbi:MAG: hypothetical protein KAR84_00100 [Elusimicrobiales bacterium]|nr:hypothetical protein [Elusimicrobiales bacterium]
MKKYILAAIVAIFVCSIAQAESVIEAISTDSKIAASSQDLNTARELSGKQIDGMMSGLKASPVQIDGEIQVAETEELVLSESKRLTLKGIVPTLTKSETKTIENTPGFFQHMGAAIVSPIVVPIAMVIAGAAIGGAIGVALDSPVMTGLGVGIGGTLGVVGGLIAGIVMIPVSIVGNVFSGLSQLFKGNL